MDAINKAHDDIADLKSHFEAHKSLDEAQLDSLDFVGASIEPIVNPTRAHHNPLYLTSIRIVDCRQDAINCHCYTLASPTTPYVATCTEYLRQATRLSTAVTELEKQCHHVA